MGKPETEIVRGKHYRLRLEFRTLFLDARTSRELIPELTELTDEARERLCHNLATLTELVSLPMLFRDHSKPSPKSILDRDPGELWIGTINSLEAAGYLEVEVSEVEIIPSPNDPPLN
jgi:hypothetical protein